MGMNVGFLLYNMIPGKIGNIIFDNFANYFNEL